MKSTTEFVSNFCSDTESKILGSYIHGQITYIFNFSGPENDSCVFENHGEVCVVIEYRFTNFMPIMQVSTFTVTLIVQVILQDRKHLEYFKLLLVFS